MSTTAWLTTLQFAGVNALFALGIYASLWTGVLSVAPIFFGAVSAFTFGYLSTTAGLPLVLGLLLGIVLGGLMGALAAGLVLRLDAHYLAMATIAMVLIGRVLVLNLEDVTGGAAGQVVPGDLGTWSWLIGSLAVAAWVMARLAKSRFGLAADAVRQDPAVAQTLWIPPHRIQFIGMVLSGMLGGAAGVMQGSFLQFIGPDTFYTHLGFVTLAAVVLGGAFHWAGPILGAVVFTVLPELLRDVMGEYDQVATGIVLIAIIIYMPRGLVDPRTFRRLRRGRGGSPPETAGPGAGPALAKEGAAR
ncbi:branched-chain amino acid ABC transporter permease [Actinomadura rugatobispora]|uniref:Branched-chain amino acid ABC transporter permease n=1 Tax=Actinomadura rugatobispora TaxID=1994 RepID=A0ABW1A614_9ACTN|nr:branched-chain amino acid ABC transporter permease [Actinomadura rugatobispora]